MRAFGGRHACITLCTIIALHGLPTTGGAAARSGTPPFELRDATLRPARDAPDPTAPFDVRGGLHARTTATDASQRYALKRAAPRLAADATCGPPPVDHIFADGFEDA